MFETRMNTFRAEMGEKGLDVALITDDDNVYYLTGYYDYLHMEFGRPTILIVLRDGPSLLITPKIDLNSAQSAARVDKIAAWNDGMGAEWRAEIPAAVKGAALIGIEPDHMPALVRRYVDGLVWHTTSHFDHTYPIGDAYDQIDARATACPPCGSGRKRHDGRRPRCHRRSCA